MEEDCWFEQFRERLFAMRKAAYEFGQFHRGFDHERMLMEQQEIFVMIDALMFEYCPDIMTPEQIEIYTRHQKAMHNALGEGRERGILREASSGEAATSTDGLCGGDKEKA